MEGKSSQENSNELLRFFEFNWNLDLNANAKMAKAVLDLAKSLNDRLGFNFHFPSIVDVGIEFFEYLSRAFGHFNRHCYPQNSLQDRFQAILQWISTELDTGLDHISAEKLANHNLKCLTHLLEIFNLLFDESDIKLSSNAEIPPIVSCPKSHHIASSDSEISNSAQDSITQSINSSSAMITNSESVRFTSDAMSVSTSQSRHMRARLDYLRSKLQAICDNIAHESSETRQSSQNVMASDPETDLSIAKRASKNRHLPRGLGLTSGSVIRSVELPLTRIAPTPASKVRRISSGPHRMQASGNRLLDGLMQHFPGLTISTQTQNNMQKQLEQIYRKRATLGLNASKNAFRRSLSEIESRQQRRLELLQKQEKHSERLRHIKDELALRRRIQTEIEDRKHQEIRSRLYYEEHAQQFRAKKLAKKAYEERTFKRIFDSAIELEKLNRLEAELLERDIKRKEAALKEAVLDDLETSHANRVRLMQEEQRRKEMAFTLDSKENKQAKIGAQLALRQRLIKQIQELEACLTNQMDAQHFRECDGDRLLCQ